MESDSINEYDADNSDSDSNMDIDLRGYFSDSDGESTDDDEDYDDTDMSISSNSWFLDSSSSLSIDSSDSEDCQDVDIPLLEKDQKSIQKYLNDVIPSYTENDFLEHFRVKRTLYTKLCEQFANSEHFKMLPNNKTYSANIHMILFLWLAGHEGCRYKDLAARFDLDLETVTSLITETFSFISNNMSNNSVIRWPTEEEKLITSEFINSKIGIKGVIGAMGVARIKISPPERKRKDYVDRFDEISICLLGVCNEKRKFLDLAVGCPGSVHEETVFKNSSSLHLKMRVACRDCYYILGDVTYDRRKLLIIPYNSMDDGYVTEPMKIFNRKLNSGRVMIDHTFDMLKQRFRQLNYCRIKGIPEICHFIRACVLLHNLCEVDDEIAGKVEQPSSEISSESDPDISDTEEGIAVRDRLCAAMFAAESEVKS